jgi:aminoglycoside phosphotransferase family enzyme/predicted kinase
MTGGAQDEVLAFLSDPVLYGGRAPQRIDTHGSVVFLAGDRAYKLKRAVAFSYMDFSTVARRAAMCRAELAVNRRTAAALYLGVAAIVRRDGALVLVPEAELGAGEVLDWVVEMRRFPAGAEFDVLAARDALDLQLVRRLAAIVARFHAAQAPVSGSGGAGGLAAVVAENRREFAVTSDLLDPRLAADADRACVAALERVAGLLDRRARDGMVRHCHGDLHLGNVCLFEGEPVPFDAIEFNPAIAIVDTLFDLAFLLMDLELRASRAHANAALNAYVEIRPEDEGLAALPLMLALRAGIRAHTRAAASRAQPDAARRGAMAADARRHLAAIAGFLAPPAPRLIAVGGVSGTGKSTLARGLAPDLGAIAPGAVILRSDAVRKELAGVDPATALAPDQYSPAATARVYEALMSRAGAILRAGHPVVLDAVFGRPEERAAAATLAAAAGIPFDGFWLETGREVAAMRIAGRRGDASDATVAVLDSQLARDPGSLVGWHRVDARGEPSQVLARARIAMSP